jgi:4-amino-4-deoxy-L-arabinose transferase-like glycosyltransferase
MRRVLTVLIALVVLSTFISPFGRDLFVGDETKYGEVIRDMRAAHVFFVPILNGAPFGHKPPIHFWLIDLLTFPLGIYSIWAFVLPSLFAFMLLLWITARAARELFESNSPARGVSELQLLAAFVCGTSLLVWASAQTARMDVSFTATIAAGATLLWRFRRSGDFRALNAAALVLAIGTLIKGPMAPIIALVLLLLERIRGKRLPRGNYLPAIAITLLVPMLWVVPAILVGGRSYAREILVKQTVGRAVSTWVHNAPPWYYLGHSPGFLLPWFFLAVVAIVAIYRRDVSNGGATALNAHEESSDAAKFCVSWIVAVLLPYSLMASKLDVYMMAMVPPVALLIAFVALRERRTSLVRWGRIAGAVLPLLFITAGIVGFTSGSRLVKGPEAALFALPNVKMLLVAMIVTGVAALLAIAIGRTLAVATIAAGTSTLAVAASMALLVMPQVNELSSTRPLLTALEAQHARGNEIALYACPYLWARDMPAELEQVHYVGPDAFRNPAFTPVVLVTSRAHAPEIAYALPRYRKTGELRMIGKSFDVYRLAGH